MNPTAIVAYLALFATVAFLFVFAALLLGRFVRAHAPTPSKQEIYECGETPIGPGYLQFDLRFYIVALLFIIFEVEVAFFFPWATVFGKATQLMEVNPQQPAVVSREGAVALSPAASGTLKALGVSAPGLPDPAAGEQANAAAVAQSARSLARMAMVDIAVFFGVLMLGFAYLWSRGDLNWVRAAPSPSRSELARPAGYAGIVANDTTSFSATIERGQQ